MADKKNAAQRLNPKKEVDGSPGKYFGAIKGWLDNVDQLDNEFEDIPLHANNQTNQITNRDVSQSRIVQKEPTPVPARHEQGERAIDEANDNINVTGMLHNIMEALKVDDAEKKAPAKKRVYSPLVRVKKVEEDIPKPVPYEQPVLSQRFDDKNSEKPAADNKQGNKGKPTVNIQKVPESNQKGNDLQIVDFEKSPVMGQNALIDDQSREDSQFFKSGGFTANSQQNGNPFANAYFPSTKLGNNTIQQEPTSPPGNPFINSGLGPAQRRMHEPNQSTIGDLSAIAADTGINRDTLDSRGSANLFGGRGSGIDQVISPGIRILESPDRIAIHDDNLDSGIFKKPESPIRIDQYGEANIHAEDVTDTNNNTKKKGKGNKNESARGRGSKAIDMLAELAANDKLGEADDSKSRDSKSKDKRASGSKLSRFFGNNKKKANASAVPNASIAIDALQAEDLDEINEDGSRRVNDNLESERALVNQLAGNTATKDGDIFEAHKAPSQRVHLSGLPKEPEIAEYKSHRASNRQSLQNSLNVGLKSERDGKKSERDGKSIKSGEVAENTQEIEMTKPIQEHPNETEEGVDKVAVPQGTRVADETRDTGLRADGRPTSALSNLFPMGNNSMMLAKGKDGKVAPSDYPLSKKVTGETDLRFDDESPLLINFTKRDVQEEESFILDHDDSQAKEFLGERRIKRTETIIELEELDVPVSSSMINLFVGFRKRVNKLEYLVNEVKKPEYTMDTFFQRNLTFFKGKLAFTKNFFFLFLMLTGVMLYFIFDTLSANDLSRVKNDDEKKFVARLFVPAAVVFTYYGMAFLYIPKKFLYWVMAAMIVPCAIVIGASIGVTFAQDKDFNYIPVYVCSYIIGINLFWWATRALRHDILTNYSWAWSMFYMTSWCILLPCATIAYAIYVSVVSRRFNYNWGHDLAVHIGVPTMILLCLTWVYYHFKFFVPAAKKKAAIEKKPSARDIEKENEEKMREQFGEVSEDEEESKEEEKKPLKLRIYMGIKALLRRISDTIIIFSSFSLGGSLIFIEGVLLVYITQVTTDEKVASPAGLYLAIFLYFFIPITVLFGIPVIANGKDHEKKMFLVPFIGILFPLFVMMPIAYSLMSEDNGHSIGLFLVLAPGIAAIFWITMSYIGLRRKKTKFGSLSFLFICFVIPLVILQPLIDIDAFKAYDVAQGFAAFFLAVGIIVLVIAFAYLVSRAMLIREITYKDRLNTDNYKLINVFKTNLQPFGYWSNSLGFIIMFTLSLYTFFHSPTDVANDLNGISLGLAFCFIIFYIYNAVALRIKVIEVTEISKYGIKSLSAAIIESVRENELFEEMQAIRDTNEKTKGIVRLFTYILVPVTGLLALGLAGVSDFALGLFATVCIGTILIHLIFEVYCGFKVKYTTIARSAVPLMLTYFWFTHALAFAGILQYSKVFFADDEKKKQRIEVQLIVLVFVITVSVIAIIANIIFKGIELEQKIKYILAYLRKQLEGIAVKSDYFVLQKIFEGWMENGEQKLKKMLTNRGKPAFWWPVPATNPNTKYSKVLLDFDAYKYMKLRLKQKLDNEDGQGINTQKKTPKKTCWTTFFSCLGCCFSALFKSKRAEYVDDELNEEIEELLDLQMHEVPLPPKEEGEESDEDSDDDYEVGDLGDWRIESNIAENKIEITDIKFKPLDERVLRAMMYYDSGIKFAHNDKWTVDFLKFVFRMFAVGNYKYFKKRWLDYIGYKRFMILSAITPTNEFPDYMIDLVYTQYTHNVGRGQIQRRVDYSSKKQQAKKKQRKNKKEVEYNNKMRVKVFPVFEEDFEGFLIHIAKRRFPNEINDRDALYRLIRWHLFPNFLHLLPSFQKEWPHEYDYLLYLIDLYMKEDAKAKAAALAAAQGEGEGNESTTNKDGEKDGINLDGDDGHGTNRNGVDGLSGEGLGANGKGGLGNLDDSEHVKGPNCLKCIVTSLCGALTKCALWFGKTIGGFFSSFFFLKTNSQKKADKEFEQMQQKADKEEKEEVKKIRADKIAETNLGDDPELQEEELNKKGQFRRKRRTYPHKPSPDWPIVVETIIKSLKEAENDYENKKASNKNPFFVPSVRNICLLICKILEVYALASLAFRREVPWGWHETLHDVLSFPSGSSGLYKLKVWTSLGFSVFYCYLGLISISFAKEGILGADKLTRKAGEFPSRGFAHSFILTFFSTALSVWIIKTFLDLFSCDYYAEINVLFFMQQVECGSTLHHWWIVVAAIGLLLYYPISSFLWPNLQYLNVGNDFKYDTSFVVMFNQAKLIIIAVTVFFPYTDEVLVPLIVSAVLFIALAVINKLLQPNTVIILNLWETSMYFICAWIQICGIIAYFSDSTALQSTLLLLGTAVILLITYVFHRLTKRPDNYEKIPQAPPKEESPVNRQETVEMAKKYHHVAKESEMPLAPNLPDELPDME